MIDSTIKAAQIQADYALISASIGAVGIILGILISWYTALHLQKVARLAETRRDVYLELIEHYSFMVNGFSKFLLDSHSWAFFFENITKFCITVDKAAFISTTKTKKELYEFLESFNENLNSRIQSVNEFMEAVEELEQLKVKRKNLTEIFNKKMELLDNLQLQNPKDERIPKILNFIDENLKESEKLENLISDQEIDTFTKKNECHTQLRKMLEEINDLTLPITHSLRKELGAKTDIKLNYKIHRNNK
ncbi:hypothetical protein V8P79_18340 [Acinetobacter baumannii]